jgi:hypothetical protein
MYIPWEIGGDASPTSHTRRVSLVGPSYLIRPIILVPLGPVRISPGIDVVEIRGGIVYRPCNLY